MKSKAPMSTPQDPAQRPANRVTTYRTCQRCYVMHWHEEACPQCGKKNPAQPDDTTKLDVSPPPAPLSDEEVGGYTGEDCPFCGRCRVMTVSGLESVFECEKCEAVWNYSALGAAEDWKQRAEGAERLRDGALRTTNLALRDIRTRLGGSPDSKLDGDDGLVARYVKNAEVFRLGKETYFDALVSVGKALGQFEGDPGPWWRDIPDEIAHLREENERLRGDMQDAEDVWSRVSGHADTRALSRFGEAAAGEHTISERFENLIQGLRGDRRSALDRLEDSRLRCDQLTEENERLREESARCEQDSIDGLVLREQHQLMQDAGIKTRKAVRELVPHANDDLATEDIAALAVREAVEDRDEDLAALRSRVAELEARAEHQHNVIGTMHEVIPGSHQSTELLNRRLFSDITAQERNEINALMVARAALADVSASVEGAE